MWRFRWKSPAGAAKQSSGVWPNAWKSLAWKTEPRIIRRSFRAAKSSVWALPARSRPALSVILADEPVASLDPRTARSVLQYLRDATRELGIAVVCNLHQVDYAREFGDRIVGLSQGRMVFDGAPDQLGDAALNAIYHQVPAMAELQEQHTPMPAGSWMPASPMVAAAGGL